MLDLIRRNSNSWLIVLLFAVIIFVFAINFGPWAGNIQGESPYAADVNGQIITFPEFQAAYTQQIQTLQTTQPGFEPTGPLEEVLKKTTLDRLIAKALLVQLANSLDFSISDLVLAQYIKTHIFGQDKKLDRATYQRAIYSAYHMSETQFENQLRKDLLAEQMSNLAQTSVAKLDNYVEFLKKRATISTSL